MELINRIVTGMLPVIPKFIVGRVASRYIAGLTLDDAIKVTRDLNNIGAMATIDLLGEDTTKKEHAEDAVKVYHQILDAIAHHKVNSNISLKPTHLGLKVSYDLCLNLITEIVQHAHEQQNFLRIDMEDNTCTDDTLKIYYKIRQKYENVGVVIQAYLRRSIKDIQSLKEMKANLRLCKGIYREPRHLAYQNRAIIIRNFAFLLEELLKAGCYVGIATHCEEVIWHALRIIHQLQLQPHQYEFQMLLGVEPELRKILIDAGHRLRVYVPFGSEWYAYSTRRLRENPKIANYVLRDMLGMKTQVVK